MGRATTLERVRVASGPRGDTGVLAGLVFALLVAACFAAFFITQRLKHTPTVVQRITMITAFSPTPFGHHKQERLSFRIAHADDVTVDVVDSAGQDVATLVRAQPLAAYTKLRLSWSGRTGSDTQGPLAPAGTYRLRILLRRQRRSVLSPRSFRLVLTPPRPVR
jgi:hypothetical protein